MVELTKWPTAGELISWIDSHAEIRKGTTPLETTCWFCACQDAEAFLSDARIRDVARLIVDGSPISGPLQTEEHIQGWLDDFLGAYSSQADYNTVTVEDEKQALDALLLALTRFYGLRT